MDLNSKIRAALDLVPADRLTWRPGSLAAPEGAGWYLRRFGQSERKLGRNAAEIIQGVASITGMVLVEYMPCWLRASHEAAGNSGTYPANGADRFLVPAAAADEIEDDDEWTRVLRDARFGDAERHEVKASIPWGQ